MARTKQGVFSWEDVLAHRYQSTYIPVTSHSPHSGNTLTTHRSPDNKPSGLPRSRRYSAVQSQRMSSKPDTRTEWAIQSQSALLARLSPELRLMIWEMVLGGMRIHIVQRQNRRMGHIVCPQTSACDICRGGLPGMKVSAGLLALSMTCKQIYCESIYMLYSLNTFEFSNTWSLTYLRPTIPADFWDAIREVELRWAFPGHWLPCKDPVKSVYFSAGRQQWVETCLALTHMQGLQTFTLQLSGSWFCEPVEKIPVFLEPLRELHLRQRWKLQLPRQPYYVKEIRNIDGDLRKRGIECVVRVV